MPGSAGHCRFRALSFPGIVRRRRRNPHGGRGAHNKQPGIAGLFVFLQ
jgi:hypothetical protein